MSSYDQWKTASPFDDEVDWVEKAEKIVNDFDLPEGSVPPDYIAALQGLMDIIDNERYVQSEMQPTPLLDAATEIVNDFNSYGEVLQADEDGEYSNKSPIGTLEEVLKSTRPAALNVTELNKFIEDHQQHIGCLPIEYETHTSHVINLEY